MVVCRHISPSIQSVEAGQHAVKRCSAEYERRKVGNEDVRCGMARTRSDRADRADRADRDYTNMNEYSAGVPGFDTEALTDFGKARGTPPCSPRSYPDGTNPSADQLAEAALLAKDLVLRAFAEEPSRLGTGSSWLTYLQNLAGFIRPSMRRGFARRWTLVRDDSGVRADDHDRNDDEGRIY